MESDLHVILSDTASEPYYNYIDPDFPLDCPEQDPQRERLCSYFPVYSHDTLLSL